MLVNSQYQCKHIYKVKILYYTYHIFPQYTHKGKCNQNTKTLNNNKLSNKLNLYKTTQCLLVYISEDPISVFLLLQLTFKPIKNQLSVFNYITGSLVMMPTNGTGLNNLPLPSILLTPKLVLPVCGPRLLYKTPSS